MGINSRDKGNRGERAGAEFMSKWTGKKFAKNPRSGGLHWQKANVNGDITCTEEGHYCPFCIEVKFYTKIEFNHLLTNPKNIDISDFWKQAQQDAHRCNKTPILLMRYNGLPKDFFFIALDFNTWSKIKKDIILETAPLNFFRILNQEKSINIIIFDSRQFITLPYKTIKKTLKKIHAKNR